MQQTIAERVQIMAAQTVSPQTLKSKFWGRQERERDVRGAWCGVNPTYSGPVRTPGGGRRVRTRKMAGEEGMAEVGGRVHAHLEGPSGFITGGVRGNFQFLP